VPEVAALVGNVVPTSRFSMHGAAGRPARRDRGWSKIGKTGIIARPARMLLFKAGVNVGPPGIDRHSWRQ